MTTIDKDTIDRIGQEGKKGIKYAKEHFKEEQKKEKKNKEDKLNKLDSKKGNAYYKFLVDLLVKELRGLDQTNWRINVGFTLKGVLMELRSPKGKVYRSGFTPTTDPLLDLNAIETFFIRAQNTIDEENQEKNKSNIIIPNNGI